MDANNSQMLSAAETLLEIKQQHAFANAPLDQDDKYSHCSDSKQIDTDEEYDEEKQVLSQIQNDDNVYHDTGKSAQLVNFFFSFLKVLFWSKNFC